MFTVTVKDIKAGRTFSLSVEQQDTVADLKQHISSQHGIPAFQQRLIFAGKTLLDAQGLTQAGVQKDATLHLVLKLKTSLTLDIRSMNGRVLTIDVQPAETVQSVKEMVEELVRFPAGLHGLNYGGKRLCEESTLQEHGVPDKATLRLILMALPKDAAVAQLAGLPPAPGSAATASAGAASSWLLGARAVTDLATLGSRVTSLLTGAGRSSGGNEQAVAEESEDKGRLRVYGDLGTLYARCGGIFGVSAFVDRCMDKWMADATLNANAAVATWHERAQRCGFKFLVTQLMGYLTGGPQCYTGRSMSQAHKHLNISPAEWRCFMKVFGSVLGEFGLPAIDAEDLTAILDSMEMECVVHDGEQVPPNPGPDVRECRCLYAKLGGIYPVALFADRLVDALIADPRVRIPVDGQKRNEASLKYLFTEVVCHATGGPEEVTSVRLQETRLLIPARKMFFLLDAAKTASDHFESATLRADLIGCLYRVQHLIVDPASCVHLSAELAERQQKVERLGQTTGVPMIYIPRGGVVRLDFGATPAQLESVRAGLEKLGLKAVEKTRVKTADEAAAGNMLSEATIAARYAAPGAFVAARKRVYGDPRTLYGRGGGVFGLARLTDRLMDTWMADPRLNGNLAVAQWHESQQKFGFKFLVTQIFGYLTGGPQRYTGQPMDAAHKHLNISPAQWDSFMAGVDRVFREIGLDSSMQRDLGSIIASFRDQVIVKEGETAPADPGLCRKRPAGDSLYAQAGGVYPLAQFADRLVELARTLVPQDPSNRRTPSGLKYLATELICSGAGGPEVVTSRGFDDAKLGIALEDWPGFLTLAGQAAAEVWGARSTVSALIVEALAAQQAEICLGVVAEEASAGAVARRQLTAAGFDQVAATAALERCHGHAERAMELLVSGWAPAPPEAAKAAAAAPPSGSEARCPFSGAPAGGQKVCPFAAAAGQGSAAASACPSPSQARASQAGRVLGSPLQFELDVLLSEEPTLLCPITLVLLLDPVIASDGCIYERAAIEELLRVQGPSPMTHRPLSAELLPAQEQLARVQAFRRERAQELLSFVVKAQKHGESAMALAALDRAGEYGKALGALAPEALAEHQRLCGVLGQPKEVTHPQVRLQRMLKTQVLQAKAEAEAVQLGLCRSAAPSGAAKSMTFTLDCSYSMNAQGRMGKARENLLKIFDHHTGHEDYLSMVTFADDSRVEFPLREVGANRAQLRHMAEAACNARGSTAFYDALVDSVNGLAEAPTDHRKWIVALTDGVDNRSRHTVESVLAAMRASVAQPALIVVGVQLSEEVKAPLQKLCTATEGSLFIDAAGDVSAIDEAFEEVAEMICE